MTNEHPTPALVFFLWNVVKGAVFSKVIADSKNNQTKKQRTSKGRQSRKKRYNSNQKQVADKTYNFPPCKHVLYLFGDIVTKKADLSKQAP